VLFVCLEIYGNHVNVQAGILYILIFWVFTVHSLVDAYWWFTRTCCSHLQCWKIRPKSDTSLLKCQYPPTKKHGVKTRWPQSEIGTSCWTKIKQPHMFCMFVFCSLYSMQVITTAIWKSSHSIAAPCTILLIGQNTEHDAAHLNP
jgi:hypothetical protein